MKKSISLSNRFKLKRSEFSRRFLNRASEIGLVPGNPAEEIEARPKLRSRPWQKEGSTRNRILAALLNK